MPRPACATLAALVILCTFAPAVRAAEPDPAGIEFFETKIRPVLATHCYECHSTKAKALKGGLQVDFRDGLLKGGDSGPSVVAGKPEESLLLEALKYDTMKMPPKGKLPDSVIADFEQWIKLNAPDPRDKPAESHPEAASSPKAPLWSLQPPRRAPLPAVKNAEWPLQVSDRFILAQLEGHGLQPAPPADRGTLLRRASFDLTGLPPRPEEIAEFINDPAPDAFAKVVDRLLASPHYGERWGRHWLDVARYAEDQAHTFKARNYPQGYRYRDWVVNALNRDMPYDRFVAEQIAADLLEGPNDPERKSALGLFALGPVYYQDNGEMAKALADEWDDRVDTLTRGVLGLTVACARCHDHKFDPISTADYYALAGIFASSEYQERPIVPQDVLDAKSRAEAAASAQKVVVDRFLDDEARKLRSALVADIPAYVTAAWKAKNQQKAKPDEKDLVARVAREEKVSEFLLKRWMEYLGATATDVQAARPWFAGVYELVRGQDPKLDLSGDAAARESVMKAAVEFQTQAQAVLPDQEKLFRRYGENFAFVSEADRAMVVPGVVPLGNLFDDAVGVSLNSALSSDKFKAVATDKSLGVDRVAQGWGKEVQIAPEIRFDFSKLGSDQRSHGAIVNDAWDASGGIRTRGEPFAGNGERTEQGVGMHANALITFDLEEIRRAGLLPPDQKFVFHADRAGLNDDTFGSSGTSVHLAVIVSRPRKAEAWDAVIAGYVNGVPVQIVDDGERYYFNGEIPPALTSNGKFARFEVPLSADARYVTLVATGAGMGPGDNTINSDHAVFSGARLVQDPLPVGDAAVAGAAAGGQAAEATASVNPQDQIHARLLSELLYDQGLLALPAAEADKRLPEAAGQQLAGLRGEMERLKKASDAIQVHVAHSLMEGQGRDLKIYLQGNPTRLGDVAPRSLPVAFTGGERKPFAPAGSGRKELALAVTSPDNPLTARVIVNRVWRGHFGVGLVRTPGNFGHLGEPPTHPELLDYLALRLIELGWSLKGLHREIMLSAAYQQSSTSQISVPEVDPENRLLWRMNRRRLEVEPWRDAMLSVTGELDATLGGPSRDLAAGDHRRRTLYAFVSRHQLNELLRLFDFPDPNITSDRRSVTTVPLQQLFALNSDFMAQRARALSARLNRLESDDAGRIRQAYLLLFGRVPTSDEADLGLAFLSAAAQAPKEGTSLSAWEQYALALLGANEFTFVD